MEKLTIEQLGEKVKLSYPQYRDVDSKTLGEKMLAKYPEYQKMIKEQNYISRMNESYDTISSRLTSSLQKTGASYAQQAQQGNIVGATGALLRGGLRTTGAVAEAAFSPIVEIKPIKKALEAIGTKLGESKIGQKLGKKIEQNPESAQDIFDVLNVVALGGGKAVEAPIARVGEKSLATAIEKPLTGIGGTLKKTGESLYRVGVPLGEETKVVQQAYLASKPTLFERVAGLFGRETRTPLGKPITEAETAARKGLVGTQQQLGVQATRVANDLWTKNVQPALRGFTGKINVKQFLSEIEKDIIKNTADLSRRKVLLNALSKVKSDFKNVSKITIEKLQNYKEDWAKFIPESYYKGKPISGAVNEIRSQLASKARTTIYDSLGPKIKQAYIDYGNLKSIAELGRKSQDQLRSKFAGRQAWEFLLDTAVVPVTTIAGQVLYRTGQGIEFIGKIGAKTVRDILEKSAISNTPKTSLGQGLKDKVAGTTKTNIENIVNKIYGRGAPTKAKRADIIIGPPASGKSRLASQVAKKNGSMIIDNDEIKKFLPGYGKGEGAASVHNLLSDIHDRYLLPKAVKNGDNIVLPKIGKTSRSLNSLIEVLSENGYSVHLSYVGASEKKILERAASRAVRTGRVVPEEYIKSVGQQPLQNFKNIAKGRTGVSSVTKFNAEELPPKLTQQKGFTDISGKELSSIVEKIRGGGISYDVLKKEAIANKPAYSLSIYPERSKIVKVENFSMRDISNYMMKNSDLLSLKNHVLGGWFDTETGSIYLDISTVTNNLNAAKKLGKEFNQKAIFDLLEMKDIPTGGTGEAIGQLPSINNRLKVIAKLLE